MTLKEVNNKILMGVGAKLRRWKEYAEQFYGDDRPKPTRSYEDTSEVGLEIRSEVI